MKKVVLIDTNIILDLLAKREPFYESAAQFFSLVSQGFIEAKVSALSFSDVHYVLSKQLSKQIALQKLIKFRQKVVVSAVNEKIIDAALLSDFSDFEDAIQYQVALAEKCQTIITRNEKDFKNSQIPVMSAEAFLQTL